MSKPTNTHSTKFGFWERIALALEAAEKTETDYMWDEITKLRTRQIELENKLHARPQS